METPAIKKPNDDAPKPIDPESISSRFFISEGFILRIITMINGMIKEANLKNIPISNNAPPNHYKYYLFIIPNIHNFNQTFLFFENNV